MLVSGGGSRISHTLRECTHHHLNHPPFRRFNPSSPSLAFPVRLSSSSSFSAPPFHHRLVSSSGEIPILSNYFSQREDDGELPTEGLSSVAGGIVALGKFDALHIGHRELAIQASRVGVPYLLSFVGMAKVLRWETRAPVVARCDRNRVLHSWAPFCGNVAPEEFEIEFSTVRHLTPRQFVEKLSKELGVRGVVAGENYRFGYKAAGDATELVRLSEEYGMTAYIINSVMDKSQDPGNLKLADIKERGQVSSTRVRHALAVGDMKYVSELLGRRHRLMVMLSDEDKTITCSSNGWRISALKSCLLNLAPKDGSYENCCVLFGDGSSLPCRVDIDATHIRIEIEDVGLYDSNRPEEFELLGIEFGD